MDADESDFQLKVIERSREVPVVVDFWAPWCAPCRTLAPVLESAASSLAGRVELVKVDTDQCPNLAQQYRIQGIPAVKAFKNGEVIDEFTGAQPASVVRQFFSLLAPSDAQLAEEKALSDAGALLSAGRLDELEPLLLQIDPRGPRFEKVESIRRLLELAEVARDFGGEEKARTLLAANEKDHEARYALGSALAARGALVEALDQFLELVTRSRKFRDDAGRRAMLVLFDQPGIDADLVRDYRRKLQIVT